MMNKICKGPCGEEKSISEFRLMKKIHSSGRLAHYRRNVCHTCCVDKQYAYNVKKGVIKNPRRRIFGRKTKNDLLHNLVEDLISFGHISDKSSLTRAKLIMES